MWSKGLSFHPFQAPMGHIDHLYYGKIVIAPLNIVLYNVFSEHGADLYGKFCAFILRYLFVFCSFCITRKPTRILKWNILEIWLKLYQRSLMNETNEFQAWIPLLLTVSRPWTLKLYKTVKICINYMCVLSMFGTLLRNISLTQRRPAWWQEKTGQGIWSSCQVLIKFILFFQAWHLCHSTSSTVSWITT